MTDEMDDLTEQFFDALRDWMRDDAELKRKWDATPYEPSYFLSLVIERVKRRRTEVADALFRLLDARHATPMVAGDDE